MKRKKVFPHAASMHVADPRGIISYQPKSSSVRTGVKGCLPRYLKPTMPNGFVAYLNFSLYQLPNSIKIKIKQPLVKVNKSVL